MKLLNSTGMLKQIKNEAMDNNSKSNMKENLSKKSEKINRSNTVLDNINLLNNMSLNKYYNKEKLRSLAKLNEMDSTDNKSKRVRTVLFSNLSNTPKVESSCKSNLFNENIINKHTTKTPMNRSAFNRKETNNSMFYGPFNFKKNNYSLPIRNADTKSKNVNNTYSIGVSSINNEIEDLTLEYLSNKKSEDLRKFIIDIENKSYNDVNNLDTSVKIQNYKIDKQSNNLIKTDIRNVSPIKIEKNKEFMFNKNQRELENSITNQKRISNNVAKSLISNKILTGLNSKSIKSKFKLNLASINKDNMIKRNLENKFNTINVAEEEIKNTKSKRETLKSCLSNTNKDIDDNKDKSKRSKKLVFDRANENPKLKLLDFASIDKLSFKNPDNDKHNRIKRLVIPKFSKSVSNLLKINRFSNPFHKSNKELVKSMKSNDNLIFTDSKLKNQSLSSKSELEGNITMTVYSESIENKSNTQSHYRKKALYKKIRKLKNLTSEEILKSYLYPKTFNKIIDNNKEFIDLNIKKYNKSLISEYNNVSKRRRQKSIGRSSIRHRNLEESETNDTYILHQLSSKSKQKAKTNFPSLPQSVDDHHKNLMNKWYSDKEQNLLKLYSLCSIMKDHPSEMNTVKRILDSLCFLEKIKKQIKSLNGNDDIKDVIEKEKEKEEIEFGKLKLNKFKRKKTVIPDDMCSLNTYNDINTTKTNNNKNLLTKTSLKSAKSKNSKLNIASTSNNNTPCNINNKSLALSFFKKSFEANANNGSKINFKERNDSINKSHESLSNSISKIANSLVYPSPNKSKYRNSIKSYNKLILDNPIKLKNKYYLSEINKNHSKTSPKKTKYKNSNETNENNEFLKEDSNSIKYERLVKLDNSKRKAKNNFSEDLKTFDLSKIELKDTNNILSNSIAADKNEMKKLSSIKLKLSKKCQEEQIKKILFQSKDLANKEKINIGKKTFYDNLSNPKSCKTKHFKFFLNVNSQSEKQILSQQDQVDIGKQRADNKNDYVLNNNISIFPKFDHKSLKYIKTVSKISNESKIKQLRNQNSLNKKASINEKGNNNLETKKSIVSYNSTINKDYLIKHNEVKNTKENTYFSNFITTAESKFKTQSTNFMSEKNPNLILKFSSFTKNKEYEILNFDEVIEDCGKLEKLNYQVRNNIISSNSNYPPIREKRMSMGLFK